MDGNLSEDEQMALEELHQYLLLGDGCWALSDLFLVFVGRILRDPQISTEARVHLLRSLAYAALKDDVILLLHQDRRDHVMMTYLLDIEKIKPEEQQAVALFVSHKIFYVLIFLFMSANLSFFSRLTIYLRIQMRLNGCYTSANGPLVANKYQISVQQQKLSCIVCCHHVQNFKNWEQH